MNSYDNIFLVRTKTKYGEEDECTRQLDILVNASTPMSAIEKAMSKIEKEEEGIDRTSIKYLELKESTVDYLVD